MAVLTEETNIDELCSAVYYGRIEKVKSLLANKVNVNGKDKLGQFPLHTAAISYSDRTNIIKLLLAAGANINMVNDNRETPLMLASGRYSTETIHLLLENGAHLETKDNNGRTALFYAVTSNKTEVVKILLNYGANKDIVDNEGDTLLSLSYDCNIIELLSTWQPLPEIKEPAEYL